MHVYSMNERETACGRKQERAGVKLIRGADMSSSRVKINGTDKTEERSDTGREGQPAGFHT